MPRQRKLECSESHPWLSSEYHRKKVFVALRMSEELFQQLESESKKSDVTISEIIRQKLKGGL